VKALSRPRRPTPVTIADSDPPKNAAAQHFWAYYLNWSLPINSWVEVFTNGNQD